MDDYQNALMLHQGGKLVEAKEAYERCLALNPHHPWALSNLGSVCRQLGQIDEALSYLNQAVVLMRNEAGYHYNLGNAQRDAGDLTGAEASYRKALALSPQEGAVAYNLGLLLIQMGCQEEAESAYRQALTANPNHLEAHLNLAALYSSQGRLFEAQQALETLLGIKPDFAPAINNLATLYQDTGQSDAALSTLKRAIELQPDLPQPRSNLLMSLQYHHKATPSELLVQAQDWGQWVMERATTNPLPTVVPKPIAGRSLRVGYVSADLAMHPVGLFLKDVLTAHDPAQVTPVIYSNGSQRDHIFAEIAQSAQAKGGGVREVHNLDDSILAAQIRADEIDILIDLSGHTGKSRLAAFAWQPAPLQISWLGYFATTGLPAVDFVILDPYHAPPGMEAQFSEGIIRLPHNRFCYTPVSFAPEVSSLPCERNDFITFGSFNNTAKLNDGVLAAWAQVLQKVSDSRLILKWRTFADEAYCERIVQFFTQHGIDRSRVELRTMSPHRELLEQYADIDIAFDPFPFSGGHTSCEALWMGVPVVTLPQERVVSRQTWSFLVNIGLPGLAAPDVDGYVKLAVGLANNRDTLKELRITLRERMRTSPLCGVLGFTRLLEEAYRKAWVAKFPPADAAPDASSIDPQAYLNQVRDHAQGLMDRLKENCGQPDLWLELTEQMAKLLRHEAVIACADEVLQRRPDDAAALTLKGNALRVIGKVDAALVCYRLVLGINPNSAEGYCNLGAGYQTLGRYPEAIAAYSKATELKPDIPAFWGNLSASLTYSPSHSPNNTLVALQGFDAKVARPLRDLRPYTNDRSPHRRLKVGYVSPDFRKHAVAYFALPLIEGHHRDQIEVYCYYNHRQQDGWTQAFKRAADHWLNVAGLSDAVLAERIRADGIDILVDLAGHTENNCLLTFARKPAPVQLTWMGYVSTTGMSAMDWRITHTDADPEGSDVDYTEKLYRLPGTMWCYRPLSDMPEVTPPPCERKGYITFGSFNRFSKNGEAVLTAWVEILQRVSNSRLIVCVPEGEIRQRMGRFFAERGIAPERIMGFAKLSHADFWKLHGEVDLALDPFPFGGGTTTCETLWLGVPVVTCTGEGGDFPPRFASRMGKTFLNNIGRPELARATIREYIDTAVTLAYDRERLTALRQGLRPAMTDAALTDERRFVREMEAAYCTMWQGWVNGQNQNHLNPQELEMTDWTAGYVADIDYTYGYYTELNPLHARLAFLNAGLVPPRQGTHCELGFGQGVSVNIHAAASGSEWHATDFNPSQASFAQELARVSGANARLHDQAFADFCTRDDLPEFDSIGLHGIWSWISDVNRAVIVDFIRRKLKVGGVLYISYNTQPGWAAMVPLRDLLTEHVEVMGADGVAIVNRIDTALAFANKLIAANPAYARANPQVAERLKQIQGQNRNYLAHEYFNRDWLPMSFARMADWLAPAKLSFACSAHYLDHIEALNLSAEQQALLRDIPDSMFRQMVRDFCVNQQFRRDYWVKGVRRLNAVEQADALRAERVILVKHRAYVSLEVAGSLGKATMQEAVYGPLLDCLADHQPKTLGESEQVLRGKINFAQILQAVMVLAGTGNLLAVQGERVNVQAKAACDRLNAHIINKAVGSADLNYLASPVSGGGFVVGRFQQLFLLARAQGKPVTEWADFVWQIVCGQGQKLIKEGKTLETVEENLAELNMQAQEFVEKQLPILQALHIAA